MRPLRKVLERAQRDALEDAQAQRRVLGPRRLDPLAQQRHAGLLAIFHFEQVDAQIERRAFIERRHLAREAAAERRFEMRREPVGIIAARRRRHVARLELLARQRLDELRLLARQRLGPEAVAVAGAGYRRRRPILDQRQRRQHAPARVERQAAALPADPPVERRPPAQHGIDVLGNGAAIAGAREAMAAEIIGDDVVGRGAGLLDLVEQADRRLDAGAGGHRGALSCQLSAVSRPLEHR